MNKVFFENLFEHQDDPWFINSRFSQHKRHLHVIQLLQNFMPYPEKILDIGCALGTFTNTLSKKLPHSSILGIDISEAAITKAQESFPHLTFETQALPYLPYDTSFFDLICALEVIYYLEPQQQLKTLEECHRILKKDGIIIITASCDPTAIAHHDALLNLINTHLFSLEHRSFTYGYLFFRLESLLTNVYQTTLIVNKKGKYLLLGKAIRFFIKKVLASPTLFYLFTLPSEIIKKKPIHQILILKKKGC